VWTYDIYQAYIHRASDHHYSTWDAWRRVRDHTVRAAAYVATTSTTSWICLQLLFAFVNAPLFATSCWECSGAGHGHGAFAGLLRHGGAALHSVNPAHGEPRRIKGGWLTLLHGYPREMAQNFWTRSGHSACALS